MEINSSLPHATEGSCSEVLSEMEGQMWPARWKRGCITGSSVFGMGSRTEDLVIKVPCHFVKSKGSASMPWPRSVLPFKISLDFPAQRVILLLSYPRLLRAIKQLPP